MSHRTLYLLFMIILLNAIKTLNGNKVGLIYDELNGNVEKIFQKAIDDANNQYPELKLQGVAVTTKYGSLYDVSKKTCELFSEGVVTIFAATTSTTSEHAFSICDTKEMPFIDTRWSSELELPGLNLHPYIDQIALAIKDLISRLNWESFTILYETGEYLSLVNEILQHHGKESITIRRYDLDLNGNYRNVLRRVKKSGQTEILVVGSTVNLPQLLTQAQQVGVLSDAYHYVIGDLDFQSIDLEPFQHSEVNITGYSLISSEFAEINNLKKIVCNMETEDDDEEDIFNSTCNISVNQGLLYDGIQMLAKTLVNNKLEAQILSCDDDVAWKDGLTLINDYKSITIEGVSGLIEFDEQNLRSNFKLEAIELTTAGIMTFGTWASNNDEDSSGNKLIVTRKNELDVIEDTRTLSDKTFIVVIADSEPYCMWKNISDTLFGNDRFEGIGIELIDELSKKLGFKYDFIMQEDGKYGSEDAETGEWDGMIKKILEKKADLGITDLTMTSERESAVDFTIPFMNLGIAILFRKPQKQPPDLFSFMSPFSQEVWGFLGISYLSVSISLFILGRLSAEEWDNPYPCIQDPTELENQFSFANSLWFTIGALLQQGSEVAPKASSTRTVGLMWSFFTLIMVSSYTANLAAFLTVESLTSPIENIEDLANNKGDTTYGAKSEGSTFKFFKKSTYPTYKKMYEYMENHPEHMTTSNLEGVSRAQNESLNYAFLMESTSLEYETERKCTLRQVGKLLDEKGYGIAMRKNWPYRDVLSKAILELQEDGTLTKLRNKWWKEKRGGGACKAASTDGDAKPLDMSNLLGVYVVLLFGCIFGIIYGLLEWILSIYLITKKNNTSFKADFIEEFKFVIKCASNTKTIKSSKLSTINSSSKSSLTMDSGDNSLNENKNNAENGTNIFSKLSKLSLTTLNKIKT